MIIHATSIRTIAGIRNRHASHFEPTPKAPKSANAITGCIAPAAVSTAIYHVFRYLFAADQTVMFLDRKSVRHARDVIGHDTG